MIEPFGSLERMERVATNVARMPSLVRGRGGPVAGGYLHPLKEDGESQTVVPAYRTATVS